MKNLQALFLMVLIVLIGGCSDDEDISVRPNPFDKPFVSGYETRDHSGLTTGVYGNPNIKLREYSEESGESYFFTIYPNPVEEYFSVYTEIPDNNAEKHLWIVPADYQGAELPSHSDMGMINFSADGKPVVEKTFTKRTLILNISNLETGFYKVYLEAGNTILYDNLVKINQ